MEKEKIKQRGFPLNAIRICIDRCDGELHGRIFNKMSATPLYFENCCEMLIRTDKLFDQCGYPQSFQNKKDFQEKQVIGIYTPPKGQITDEEMLQQKGKLQTLNIYIKSRRNAGWQGSIWEENGVAGKTFHSERELLKCITESTDLGTGQETSTEVKDPPT